jgi:putative PIN family toxin of toxin-antitoxin system
MTRRRRAVFDTNAFVSRSIFPSSVPAKAVGKALTEDLLSVSNSTWLELSSVLQRRKFDRYVSQFTRDAFMLLLGGVLETVAIDRSIQACRDPKDDKFLEVAANGNAAIIVTGDADLLVPHPFQGI